jgi:hypothetical protein
MQHIVIIQMSSSQYYLVMPSIWTGPVLTPLDVPNKIHPIHMSIMSPDRAKARDILKKTDDLHMVYFSGKPTEFTLVLMLYKYRPEDLPHHIHSRGSIKSD